MDYLLSKKLRPFLIITSSLLWLTTSYAGGYKNSTPPATAVAPATATASTAVPPFSAISVQGPVKVVLIGGQKRQSTTLLASPKDGGKLTMAVENQVLIIRAPEGSKKFLLKVGTAQPLTAIDASGSANVWGKDIHSNGLNITADGNSVVYLRGKHIAVNNIQTTSNNTMDIANIDSNYLNLEDHGNGRTTLVGKTNVFNANVTHNAKVDARKLRTNDLRVQTHNESLAHVFPVTAMYAFAYDDSNIYYYNLPSTTAMASTAESGNVLEIRGMSDSRVTTK